MGKLDGKVALVTGANRGIGRGIARGLAREGAALVLTAGFDPLQDERREYAERLKREGVRVEYRDYADMIHGFIVMGGVLDTANEAVADCCAALRRAFEKVKA